MTQHIQIAQKTTKSAPEFRKAVDEAFVTITEMYNVTGAWESGTLYSLSGASIEGFVMLVDGYVEVSLTLGALLVPFSKTIESMVSTALKERLK